MICTIIKSGTINKQDAWVIGWSDYFITLVRRGKQLHCKDIYRIEIDDTYLVPRMTYQSKRLKNTQYIIRAAKIWFNGLNRI